MPALVVNNDSAFDHIQSKRAGKYAGNEKEQQMRHPCKSKGIEQTAHDLRRIFHLKGIDDNAWCYDIYHDHRNAAAVVGAQQFGFYDDVAH